MFWSIVIFFICLFFSFQISTLPYSNPYTLTMIFGKKGSGKTTTMTKLAHQALRRGQACLFQHSAAWLLLDFG